MKKKKLDQLQLKKTTISCFSKKATGGQGTIIRPTLACTLECPSQPVCPPSFGCPETFTCPTFEAGCITTVCPSDNPAGCGPATLS